MAVEIQHMEECLETMDSKLLFLYGKRRSGVNRIMGSFAWLNRSLGSEFQEGLARNGFHKKPRTNRAWLHAFSSK